MPRHRWGAFMAALGATTLFACEPTPDYPTQQEPVIDTIYDERSFHTSGADQTVELAYNEYEQRPSVRISLPAAAYPKDTWVTFRLLVGLSKVYKDRLILNDLVFGSNGTPDCALQVLPDDRAPAVPLAFELSGWGEFWNYDLLHADVHASQWTAVATNLVPVVIPAAQAPVYGNARPSIASTQLRFEVTMPGLWSAAMPRSPPQLRGLLRRTEVQCDGKALAAPRDATLHLSGDRFVWRRQTAAGCTQIATGTLTVHSSSAWIAFSFSAVTSQDWSFSLDRAGNDITGLWLESDEVSDCGESSYVQGREHYVHVPGSENDPPDLAGGCAPTP